MPPVTDPGVRAVADKLQRGIETRDAALLASLYDEDCEHLQVNRNAPPSHPGVLHGRAALAEMWREDCSREMTHRVEFLAVDGPRIALRVRCRYPDGTLVSSAVFAEVERGHIVREFAIDCWDE